MGNISGDNERASNMPCPECGALPAEQISKTLSDEELRRVAQCVLGILRAEESSHKAADRSTTVEQDTVSDDGSDGAMSVAAKLDTTLANGVKEREANNQSESEGEDLEEIIPGWVGARIVTVVEPIKPAFLRKARIDARERYEETGHVIRIVTN